MPTLIDHFFVFTFAIIYPLYVLYDYQKVVKATNEGRSDSRVKIYQTDILTQLDLFIVALAIWLIQSRPLEYMGYQFAHTINIALWVAVILAIVLLAYFAYLVHMAKSMPAERREQL